jgi:hypothetical protein
MEKLNGGEFIGIRHKYRIERREGKRRLDNETEHMLWTNPLFNAIWGARTLVFKYHGEKMTNEHAVKNVLKRYNGSQDIKNNYANTVWRIYLDNCRLIEKERRKNARMLSTS